MNKEEYNNELALSIKAKIKELNALIDAAQTNGLVVEVKNNSYTWGEDASSLCVRIYELKEYPTECHIERTCSYCNRNKIGSKPNLQRPDLPCKRFQHDLRFSGEGGNKEYAEIPCDYCLESRILPKMRRQLEEEMHNALLRS